MNTDFCEGIFSLLQVKHTLNSQRKNTTENRSQLLFLKARTEENDTYSTIEKSIQFKTSLKVDEVQLMGFQGCTFYMMKQRNENQYYEAKNDYRDDIILVGHHLFRRGSWLRLSGRYCNYLVG